MLRSAILTLGMSLALPATATAQATKDDPVKFELRADAAPVKPAWTQPASFAYTFNNDGDDSYAIAFAGSGAILLTVFGEQSVELPIEQSDGSVANRPYVTSSQSLSLKPKLIYLRNNQQSKEQDSITASIGISHSYTYNPPPETEDGGGPVNEVTGFYLGSDLDFSYNRKGVFPIPKDPRCEADSTLPFCDTQFIETARVSLTSAPFHAKWEQRPSANPNIAYTFSPVFSAFYDTTLNNKIDPETGIAIEGSVSGISAKAGVRVAPSWSDYRWSFSLEGQVIQRLSASGTRELDFEKSPTLVTASIDFALVEHGLDKEGVFVPSIGLQYSNGSDPLVGRSDQDTLTFALRVRY